ncbi:Mortality factor 4-like protein 2 [Lemmus lemmus]
MPVPKNMQNIREKRVDSGPSTVPQIPHQNVAGTVTTGQSVQAGKMRMRVELKLPEELKPCLVEDWELINKHKQLFQLPAKKTVDTLLAEYVTFVKSQWKADNREYSVDELVYGIREYFNMMLGTQLLYQFEKPQYAEIHLAYPHIPMSQVYGAPHLLRLFTQFETVLTHSGLTRQSLMRVSSYLHDFLKYLIENSTSLFSASNYKVASAEYCCQAL